MNRNIPKSISAICIILMLITLITCIAWTSVGGNSDNTNIETAVLKVGSGGSAVKTVQNKLIQLTYLKGVADGIFGSKTKNAVLAFQRDKRLTVDGIVGAKTAKALGISLNSGGNSGYSGSDVYLLAKCIHAEARGEPYIGQVAVGAVILNRVRDPEFPNTIAGVIYEPWAFTAVHDGQINLEPNDSAKRAARDAINGWDPSNGCVFYYNPAKTTNKWIWSRPVQLVIGKHRFAT